MMSLHVGILIDRSVNSSWPTNCHAITPEKVRMTDYIQTITATETEVDAQAIANTVVGKRVAACAQIIGPITSTYWWQGKIETAEEWLCVIKSRKDIYKELEEAIQRVHPYEVPEILAMPVIEGSRDYLEWLDGCLTG